MRVRLALVAIALGNVCPARAEPLAAVGAGLFLPPSGGALGAALHVDAAYEWSTSMLALAPGLRFSGYLGPQRALAGLVALRTTLPRSIARPYLLTAIGAGLHERPALAFELGAGLAFAVTPRVCVGGEGSYVQLGDGSFRQVYLGPLLQVGF